MDKTSTSKACPLFIAETKTIAPVMKRDAFDHMVALFQEIPDDALRSLASMLYQEKHNRRLGFHFGQKVYVRYRGATKSDYMSNFMIARVMSSNKEYIRLTSQDGRCNLTYQTKIHKENSVIYTVDEFNKLRTKMIEKGKMVDPDAERLITKKLRAEEEYDLNMTSDSANGQITTIDTVFKENKAPRRKGKQTVDLVTLVNGLMEGHDVSRDSKTYEKTGKRKTGKSSRGRGDSTINMSGD